MNTKTILTALCSIVTLFAQAREITYNVYYNEITKTRGELYLYSERYLGTSDVILEDSHSYQLDKIKMVVDTPNAQKTTNTKLTTKTLVKEQLPLSEETLMAANTAKKAESVAKQIYRIRETRMNILSGDVEHAPADGKAMQLVLDELNKQEQALTSMFVGTTVIKSHRKSISVNINDKEKAIKKQLLKFSTEQGPLDIDAQHGNPITLSIIKTTEPVLAPNQPKKGEPVYEEKVISSTTTITYQNKTVYEKADNL